MLLLLLLLLPLAAPSLVGSRVCSVLAWRGFRSWVVLRFQWLLRLLFLLPLVAPSFVWSRVGSVVAWLGVPSWAVMRFRMLLLLFLLLLFGRLWDLLGVNLVSTWCLLCVYFLCYRFVVSTWCLRVC